MSVDMWITASQNVEAETNARKLSMARVATAKFWPTVANASTERGVENALAIISNQVTATVTPIAESEAEVAVLASKVLDSFRDDWKVLAANTGESSSEKSPSNLTQSNPPAGGKAGEYAASHKNSEGVAPWGNTQDVRDSNDFWNVSGPAKVDSFNPTTGAVNTKTCKNCGESVEKEKHEGKDFWIHSHSGSWGCDFGGPKDIASPKKAVIENAPAAAAAMEAQWGLPVEPIDTAEEQQAAVTAWEHTPHDTRITDGGANGIGTADESSGRNVAGPLKNNGEEPAVTGVSHDEDTRTAAYRVNEFGGIDYIAPDDRHKYSNLIRLADDDDEVDENEDMQSEGSLNVAAIKAAQNMVDSMPKEASVEAVKKEMQRRAKSFGLSALETDLVVSAAVTHAHSRGRRPLDKMAWGHFTCDLCGKQFGSEEKLAEHKAEVHHEASNQKEEKEAKLAAGPGADLDSFFPSADGGTSMGEDSGGSANTDDMAGSDPGGLSTPSNLDGESMGGSGASADLEDAGQSLTAMTSPPRTKPSHNPNAPKQDSGSMGIQPGAMPGAGMMTAQPMTPAQPTAPLVSPMMAVRKLKVMTDGILQTNPGMERSAALKLAENTLERYPSILAKEARGGADWPEEGGTYTECPQCSKPGFDSRTNACHWCQYVYVKGTAPAGSTPGVDPLAGKTTIHPAPRNLRNPGTK